MSYGALYRDVEVESTDFFPEITSCRGDSPEFLFVEDKTLYMSESVDATGLASHFYANAEEFEQALNEFMELEKEEANQEELLQKTQKRLQRLVEDVEGNQVSAEDVKAIEQAQAAIDRFIQEQKEQLQLAEDIDTFLMEVEERLEES